MLKIIEKTKVWFAISLIILVIGMVSLAVNGLEYGLDFKGGTATEISIGQEFEKADVDAIINKYSTEYTSAKVDNTNIEIKSANLTAENVAAIVTDIKAKYAESSLTSQELIGATIGSETKAKAVQAIIIAFIAMLIYVGIRFEFNFGVSAIITLVHDMLVMVTVYSVFRIPVDSSFIAAILTVIGFSINDTIVVFDRIRENQRYIRNNDIAYIANASITQTLARSINTVLTVLITLTAVYIFVPAIRNFSAPLLIGIAAGSYSSIFISSPMWVVLKNYSKKRKLKAAKNN
ncbi:MAG TPA: protein translocase subunit SecF [Clostridiaceae bacterium]|nr:protein translocase subunit SecF [Clostridiaceae bacterium]